MGRAEDQSRLGPFQPVTHPPHLHPSCRALSPLPTGRTSLPSCGLQPLTAELKNFVTPRLGSSKDSLHLSFFLTVYLGREAICFLENGIPKQSQPHTRSSWAVTHAANKCGFCSGRGPGPGSTERPEPQLWPSQSLSFLFSSIKLSLFPLSQS